MKINSQTLLGRSRRSLPSLKIFPASKAKPIYIANASVSPPPSPPLLFLELETAQAEGGGGRREKKSGDFSFAGNLETLSS